MMEDQKPFFERNIRPFTAALINKGWDKDAILEYVGDIYGEFGLEVANKVLLEKGTAK